MMVAGGELDPAFPGADVFVSTPPVATVPPGKACAVAQRYVELVNAGKYAEVAALYADDATFLEPMRPSLKGREQIDAFYTGRIGGMQPTIRAITYLGDETRCMVELALQAEFGGEKRFVLVSVDHFVVRADGKIASMTAFARPMRSEP
jgi:ketosteroid isomerase-like protein